MFQRIPWVVVNGLTAVLAIGAVGAGASYASSAVSQNDLIGEDAAEEFAILDAGVSEDETSDMFTRLVKDDGIYVYDIEFYVGNVKYEYEIRGEDGAVVEKDVEKKKSVNQTGTTKTSAGEDHSADTDVKENTSGDQTPAADPGTADQGQAAQTPAGSGGYISVDQAKQIALDHAELTEDQVRFTTAKFEDDNDGKEYEIEFYYGSVEYEYDIDAYTGEILEYDVDKDDD